MATSSIQQTVLLKDKRKVARLVRALESSKTTKAKDVKYSRPVTALTDKDEIRKIFGEDAHDRIPNNNA